MIRKLFEKVLRLIFHNFGYKLLSLFLAVIVWAIIQGEQIRGDLNRLKPVTVRGPQAWLMEVPSRLTADIYIPPGKLGRYRVRLSKDDFQNMNERLEVIFHEPYLDLYIDRLMERIVPIKEAIHGTPAEGYIVEKVTIEPRNVTVKGIRTDLLKLRYVYTEPIDVSGLQESRVVETRLVSPGLGPEALSVNAARVSLQIGDSKINKRFGHIPIELVGNTGVASVKPGFVAVLIQGVPGVLNFVKRTDFKAFVEVRELAPGRYEQDIKVKIPADTVLIETFPEKGIVTIEKK
jgi:hypothetical protein